jgi:ribosomal protein L11 methyltransferase
MPMPTDADESPLRGPCVVEVAIDARVTLPGGDTVSRDDFHAWLWARADGLLGIDEGTVTAAEAAERGLAPTELVIDAAAAPADRDWVAGLAVANVEWWFSDEDSARVATDLVADVIGCRILGVRTEAPVDHEQASRASFAPIAVAGFGVVRPAWEEGNAGIVDDGLATIFIEPGLGFGTGLHETTQLCLAALSQRARRGMRLERVLDYGSGSGILAIAAAVLGATRVDAVEIDGHVHTSISANAIRNGVADMLHLSHRLPPRVTPYDLVVANIVAPVLIEHAAALCARVDREGGSVVLSGLLDGDVHAVAAHYAALLGCEPTVGTRGDWRCLSFDLA